MNIGVAVLGMTTLAARARRSHESYPYSFCSPQDVSKDE